MIANNLIAELYDHIEEWSALFGDLELLVGNDPEVGNSLSENAVDEIIDSIMEATGGVMEEGSLVSRFRHLSPFVQRADSRASDIAEFTLWKNETRDFRFIAPTAIEAAALAANAAFYEFILTNKPLKDQLAKVEFDQNERLRLEARMSREAEMLRSAEGSLANIPNESEHSRGVRFSVDQLKDLTTNSRGDKASLKTISNALSKARKVLGEEKTRELLPHRQPVDYLTFAEFYNDIAKMPVPSTVADAKQKLKTQYDAKKRR